MKYDFNKCTKEQLASYAEAALVGYGHYGKAKDDVLSTAEVKLRTRAEVDADIAKVIREYAAQYHVNGKRNLEGFGFDYRLNMLQDLVNEETQG
jgi:hypothetical protein